MLGCTVLHQIELSMHLATVTVESNGFGADVSVARLLACLLASSHVPRGLA